MAKKDQLARFEQRQKELKAAQAASAPATAVDETPVETSTPVESVTPPEVAPVEAVIETPAPVKEPVAPVVKTPPVSAPPASISIEVQAMKDTLASFVEKMRPNHAIQPDDGANLQIQLSRRLLRAIENPNTAEAHAQLTLLLDAFRAHATGCFSDSYLYRFMDHVRYRGAFSAQQGRLITRVLHSLSVIARSGFKDFEKLVSPKVLLSEVTSPVVEANLSTFFQRT